jgi:hypothetical protein
VSHWRRFVLFTLLPGLAYMDVAVCSPASLYHGLASFSCITAAASGLSERWSFSHRPFGDLIERIGVRAVR